MRRAAQMLGLAARELRHRPLRGLLLAAGVFVAALSFGLLSSETASSRLQVTSTVRHNFRSAYDILVRPKGAATAFERRHHLVDDSFLSGLFGGITLRQYREIRSLPGVSLAAPVANVGFFIVDTTVFVPFPKSMSLTPDSVYRVNLGWNVHDGLSRYPGAAFYLYYTHDHLTVSAEENGFDSVPGAGHQDVCGAFLDGAYAGQPHLHNGVPTYTPGESLVLDPYKQALLPRLACASPHVRLTGIAAKLPVADKLKLAVEPAGKAGVEVSFGLPVLVAGIHPSAEARLVGLRGAMVSGRYLREGEGLSAPQRSVNLVAGAQFTRTYPVIGSIDTFLDQKADLSVRRLQLPGQPQLSKLLGSTKHAYRDVAGAKAGPVLARVSVSPTAAWRNLLASFNTDYGDRYEAYWRIGPTSDTIRGATVVPTTVANDPSVWSNASLTPATFGISLAPPGTGDVWYRYLRVFGQSGGFHQVDGHSTTVAPSPLLVGTFNPGRLRGFSPLSRVPLQTFYPPLASAGDRAAKRLLGRKPLGPTTNLGGYLSQPPMLLTTLQGAIALDNGEGDRAKGVGAYAGASPAAPLSSIQVRVRGVTGPNALSLARIKLVAEQIQSRTGLTVDVTAGSSPTDVPVQLQAGKYGQPRLRLVQGWVKEDVDSAIVQALSGKDLSLIVVLSLACCLFVGAAAFAGVRQRRREIAILGTIGWRARTIFGLVLSETTLTGLLGGALACALTVLIASVGSLDIPAVRLALIIPVAGAVALTAGAVPAFSAARMTPLDALRPPAVRARRARRVHGVPSLALANLVRSPGRSLVAVVTLALAVATLNVLVGIQVAFHGAVAGDLLGQVVSVDVRHVDTISTLMVLIVAIGGVADVLLTSLRERGRELGALLACGWSERDITHLVVYEAAGIGLAGSILGAVVGVIVIASLKASTADAVATVLIVAAAGVALTVLATALPFARVSRRAPASLIATTDE